MQRSNWSDREREREREREKETVTERRKERQRKREREEGEAIHIHWPLVNTAGLAGGHIDWEPRSHFRMLMRPSAEEPRMKLPSANSPSPDCLHPFHTLTLLNT